MTILNVSEDIREGSGSAQVEGLVVVHTAVRVFTVEFDDGDDPWLRTQIALDDAITPAPWDTHPFDDYMFVTNKGTQVISPHLIKVICNYTSRKNPLDERPVVEWSFNNSNEPIDRDIANAALVNSAGESFDPAISQDHADLMVKIDRNEGSVNPLTMIALENSLNEDLFLGLEPGKARVNALTAREARAGDLFYWQVHYEIQFRFDGFKRRILDEGFRKKTNAAGAAPTWELFTDDAGKPLSQPVLLDGSGEKLTDGADPVFLEFDTHRSATFASLDLEELLLTA